MGYIDLAQAFPDEGNTINGVFFSSTDVSERTWGDVKLLSEADDATFWTVIARNTRLAAVFFNLITAVDHAHSSTSIAKRRAVHKADEQHLAVIFVRLATTTDVCVKRNVDPGSLASRMESILSLKSLFPLASMFSRLSGSVASVTIASLFLLNPGYLPRVPVYMESWFDTINRVTGRCVAEMQRGRFQRLSGDILPLIERTYRAIKQLWAAVQCAPFLADYLPLGKTLRHLRIAVEVISPALQHCLMLCETLNSRRPILTRANSVIVNAAMNISSILVLFRTFEAKEANHHSYGGSGTRRGGSHKVKLSRTWTTPGVVQATFDSLTGFIGQYARGVPFMLLSGFRGGNVQNLVHQLVPPRSDEEDIRIGPLLLMLMGDIKDSKDFADLLLQAPARYFELLLMELVRQRMHIDTMLEKGFLSVDEARQLGASDATLAKAVDSLLEGEEKKASGAAAAAAALPTSGGGPPLHPTPSPPPVATPKPVTPSPAPVASEGGEKNPLVQVVRDVFPDYSLTGIRAALEFYNNDAEQFIFDASMENVPPHLHSLLVASDALLSGVDPEPSITSTTAAAAASLQRAVVSPVALELAPGLSTGHRHHLCCDDFDGQFEGQNFHLFLGGDLYELNTSDEDDVDNGGRHNIDAGEHDVDYATYGGAGAEYAEHAADAFDIDESLKEKIRLLNEIIYEDEPDDAQLILDMVSGRGGDDNDSDDEADNGANAVSLPPAASSNVEEGSRAAVATVPGQPRRRQLDDYDVKRRNVGREKERAQHVKQVREEREGAAPSYVKKKKTTKEKAGGGKNALSRAFKKGRLGDY